MRNHDGHVEIKNPARVHQFINYEGMEYDGCMPTDIDAFHEYNRNYIIYEYKYGSKDMPLGQRIAFEHAVDDWRRAGRNAAVFLCSHNVGDPKDDVRGAEAIVTSVYFDGRWQPGAGRTVTEMTRSFLDWCQALGT